MKGYSAVLVEEFAWNLNRELTSEEIDFLQWLAFKMRLEKGKRKRQKKKY